MNNKTINSTVAQLESRIDYLETELCYLDQILIQCGFPQGVTTLKATVEEMISE